MNIKLKFTLYTQIKTSYKAKTVSLTESCFSQLRAHMLFSLHNHSYALCITIFFTDQDTLSHKPKKTKKQNKNTTLVLELTF